MTASLPLGLEANQVFIVHVRHSSRAFLKKDSEESRAIAHPTLQLERSPFSSNLGRLVLLLGIPECRNRKPGEFKVQRYQSSLNNDVNAII
jgi:hypothetical protein